MDNLSGLDWSASSKPSSGRLPPANPSSAFSALRPTPTVSGRSTPTITSNPPSKPATPANDSFSNLISFNASSANKSLPLLEQQKRLAQQKAEQEKAKQEQLSAQFHGGDESFWENIGSGRSTPANGAAASGSSDIAKGHAAQDEDDFMAVFNEHATTKINPFGNGDSNKSSGPLSSSSGPVSKSKASRTPQETGFADDGDDDIFGLNQWKTPKKPHLQGSTQDASLYDEDDVLGALSRPVSGVPTVTTRPIANGADLRPETTTDPHDRAVAELVDMGFPTEQAAIALATTESASDVSGAVSWLLQQAHADARSQMQTRRRSGNSPRASSRGALRHRGTGRSFGEETDLRQETRRRREGASNGFSEKDPTHVAAEFGNNLLKTAGSLWKTGRERMQQAVQEFNSDSDSSQPRWMKEPAGSSHAVSPERIRDEEVLRPSRRRKSSGAKKAELVTDEALMLESDLGRPRPRKTVRPKPETRVESSADNSRDHSPAKSSRLRESVPTQPALLKQQSPALPHRKAALSRQAIEEEASQAYVSSARRRKPANPPPPSASTSDLLETTTKPSIPSRPSTTVPSRPQRPAAPIPVHPKISPRTIPPMSNTAAKAVGAHRDAGDAHVARGDYAAAHQSYSTAIASVPDKHPVLIVLLTAHSGTAAKIGEPRTTIADSDRAIAIIGPSKGQSEMIQLGPGTPPAFMREQYGKALMHKAEALEQLEKWNEAAAMWREAIGGGHGGATSIQGRARAEKAANPEASRPKPPVAKKPALARPAANAGAAQATSAAAVNRLRAANAAADKADDERFVLADSVATRITAWKGGKADNLRALLSSLDTVLWPDANWKKIGMAELVLPGKVKVQYMKGIAKVHPDKIPTTASTEQRMIAGAVFSTLNEAWDKFKAENGL